MGGTRNEVPNPPPPPLVIGRTILFPLTLRSPYAMPKFSAIIPDPETTGDFEEMGLPAGGESVRLMNDILPAATIVEDMMSDAADIMDDQDEDR